MKKIIFLVGAFSLFTCVLKAQTNFRGFADVNYVANLDGKPTGTTLGQYDSYVTSQINDNISFLGEVVFEYDAGWVLDVERIIVKYSFSDALNIEAGKFHTPLGYWNNAYHHGSLLEPTIFRPLPVKFEDEGGVLPIHTTGIWLNGRSIGKFNFGYDLMLGNGIGSTTMGDNNTQKSITAGAHIKPIEGLIIGGSYYSDFVSAGTMNQKGGALNASLIQHIANGYLVFKKKNLEFIGEYFNVSNASSTTTTNSSAYFAYLGYTLKKFTPYVQYDNATFDANDPFFLQDNKSKFTAGVRYDFSYLAVLKLGYEYQDSQMGGISNTAITSFAIGF